MRETWRACVTSKCASDGGDSKGAPNATLWRQWMPGACRATADLIDSILPDSHWCSRGHLAIWVTYWASWDCRNTNLWDLYMWMCATINPLCMNFLQGRQRGTWPEYQRQSLAPLYGESLVRSKEAQSIGTEVAPWWMLGPFMCCNETRIWQMW